MLPAQGCTAGTLAEAGSDPRALWSLLFPPASLWLTAAPRTGCKDLHLKLVGGGTHTQPTWQELGPEQRREDSQGGSQSPTGAVLTANFGVWGSKS